MKNSVHRPSLLSYLNPQKGRLGLRIALSTQDPSQLQNNPFPFRTICDSDPMARLVEAHVVSDAGRSIKRVGLFFQKDRYQFIRSGVWPLNNRDLERCWQRAIELLQHQTDSTQAYPLATQTGDDGVGLPYQSLFFCHRRRIFFHPPCPKCGLSLDLCTDDALLIRAGLKPYTGSLRRYLYCPNCHSQDQAGDFFVVARNPHDPPELKDCRDLIEQFGHLADRKAQTQHWPCADCTHFESCYGDQQLASARVIAFAFYPFYLVVVEAPSINYFEFIALVAGAERAAIEQHLSAQREPGRLYCWRQLPPESTQRWFFFAKTDPKFSLEVLFLKLTFLGELIRSLREGSFAGDHPDLRFSIDRVWIEFCGQGKLMPALWNFKVRPIDIGQNIEKNQIFPKMSVADTPYLFFLVWFYTLLINARQGIADIFLALGRAMEAVPVKFDNRLGEYAQGEAATVFSSGNILWDAPADCIEILPASLWGRTLDLGWKLLDGFADDSRGQTEWDAFWQKFEGLREDIQQRLFYSAVPAAAHATSAPDVTPPEGDKIHQILEKMIQKERLRSTAEDKTKVPKAVSDDLGRSKLPADDDTTRPNYPPGQPTPVDPETPIPEAGCEQAQTNRAFDGEVGPVPQEALFETVIIDSHPSDDRVGQDNAPPDDTTVNKFANLPDGDEFLSETIIIDPKKPKGSGPR